MGQVASEEAATERIVALLLGAGADPNAASVATGSIIVIAVVVVVQRVFCIGVQQHRRHRLPPLLLLAVNLRGLLFTVSALIVVMMIRYCWHCHYSRGTGDPAGGPLALTAAGPGVP